MDAGEYRRLRSAVEEAASRVSHKERIKKINTYFLLFSIPFIFLLAIEIFLLATDLEKPELTISMSKGGELENLLGPALKRANFSVGHPVPLTSQLLGIPSYWTVSRDKYESSYTNSHFLKGALDDFPRNVIYESLTNHSILHGTLHLQSPEDIIAVIPDGFLAHQAVKEASYWRRSVVTLCICTTVAHFVLIGVAWFFARVLLQPYFWIYLPTILYFLHGATYIAALYRLGKSFATPSTARLHFIFNENFNQWGLVLSEKGPSSLVVLLLCTGGFNLILFLLGTLYITFLTSASSVNDILRRCPPKLLSAMIFAEKTDREIDRTIKSQSSATV